MLAVGGSEGAAGCDRRVDAGRAARSGAGGADGLQLCAVGAVIGYTRGGRVCAGTAHLDPAARKGGKVHEMPCHHNLDEYLHAYIEQAQLVDARGRLFRSAAERTRQLSAQPMRQADVYRMIARRAFDRTKIGCH